LRSCGLVTPIEDFEENMVAVDSVKQWHKNDDIPSPEGMADIEKAACVGRSCRSCSRTADCAEVGSGEGGKASQVGKSEVGKAWKRISQIRKSGAPPLRAQKKISKPRLKPGDMPNLPCARSTGKG
jgi:hypothetical protein